MSSSSTFVFDPAIAILQNLPPEVDEFEALKQLNPDFTDSAATSNTSFNPDFGQSAIVPSSPMLPLSLTGDIETSARLGSTQALAAIGRIIKRAKKFSDSTEAEFDAYCQTVDVEERMLLQFGVSLEVCDLLKDLQKPENWVISEDLKKTITRYAKAFMLSPNLVAYKGNAPEQILKLMRELNVRDLPAEKHVVETAEIKASLAKDADEDVQNIANLTESLISNTNIGHSYALYFRIASLRWIMKSYPKEAESAAYWAKVDATLKGWHDELKDAVKIAGLFKHFYNLDIASYGDPLVTTHEVVAPNNTPSWLVQVNSYAGRVTSGVASSGGKGKRKLAATDIEDNGTNT